MMVDDQADPDPMRPMIAAVALVALQLAPVTPSPSDQLFARFAAYLEALRTQAGIPGLSAVVIGQNDIIWERGFGQQDLSRSLPATPDTPYHLDGLTETLTAAIVLRCAEENRLSLDDPIGTFADDTPDNSATLRQILTHTSPSESGLVYAYRPERLDPLASAVRACTGDSYRETVANLLEQLVMYDSVPGVDAPVLVPPAEGIPEPEVAARYVAVLNRLALPYSVVAPGGATLSIHPDATLTPRGGLIGTARDYARFDVALKNGLLLPETLQAAWTPPPGTSGQPLPHGLGWFVQTYGADQVVWQFGVSAGASSSMVVELPSRGLTLVLLANSDGLVSQFDLGTGDVTTSPFAKVFLGLFDR
jgi:CubicO group peptidase (beta-lactamase class C family)